MERGSRNVAHEEAACPESSRSSEPSRCSARLTDGPIGVTEVAERVAPAEDHGRPAARVARARGRRRAGPGRDALPPRAADRDASRRALVATREPRRDRPAAPRRARRRDRRGRRAVGPGGRPDPLRRPGRHRPPGRRPRLDRHPDPDARGVVRARRVLALWPPARFDALSGRPLERFTERTIDRAGAAAGPAPADPARGLRLDARRVRRRDHVGRGRDRRRGGEVVAAVHVHGPSYRFPAAGGEAALGAAGRDRRHPDRPERFVRAG